MDNRRQMYLAYSKAKNKLFRAGTYREGRDVIKEFLSKVQRINEEDAPLREELFETLLQELDVAKEGYIG